MRLRCMRAPAGREKRWAHRRGQRFALFFSSSTDPWQPVERTFRITRKLLAAMQRFPPDVLILQTHSPSLRDDLDRIESLARLCELRIHVSIEGDRERLPGMAAPASPLEARWELLEELSGCGLCVVACVAPLYPLDDPEKFFRRLAGTGVRAVIIDHFIGGDGSANGARTLKTPLPTAMSRVLPGSAELSYREQVSGIARKFLPVGLSAAGFAGQFSR